MAAVNKTDDEWRMILTKEQFRVLRQKGTEASGTGNIIKLFLLINGINRKDFAPFNLEF